MVLLLAGWEWTDKRSATDEVWLYLSESSHAEQGLEVERLLCIATAGGAFYQLPLLAIGEASMLASSTIQHSGMHTAPP